MKITEYGKVTSIDENTVFLLDGDQGTKTVLATDLIKAVAEISDPKLHRMIYGGRYLGESVTEEQKAVIRDGTFKGMLVGDYWTINKVNWRIVDIDYWYNTGYPAASKCLSHHLVIMPDTVLYNAQMNEEANVTGAYVGSKMYTTNLTQAKETINTAFPNLVLKHKEYLANTVVEGHQSAAAWVESTVELPNEIMIYGTKVFMSGTTDTVTPVLHTVEKQQLALFAICPQWVNIYQNYWLRDVVSKTSFAYVNNSGCADWRPATLSLGVRPVFAIG